MLAAPASALGGGFADARSHQAFHFQAIQGDVDSADGQIATGAGLNLSPDGRAVGVWPQPQKRQHDQLFEFPEHLLGPSDMIHNVNHITDGRAAR